MASSRQDVLNQFRISRVIWPVLIGLLVMAYAIYKISQEDITLEAILAHTTWQTMIGWLGLGFLFMIFRDIGYIWRMRILTDEKLSWRSAFEVTILWEFASALTPSVVGGSALAIFMLIKEKISAGRSTAIVFVTIFLDEVFYIVILPLLLLVVSHDSIFDPISNTESTFGTGLIMAFWIAYGVLIAYTIFLAFALFIRPDGTSRVIRRIFKTKLLNRWERSANTLSEDLLIASHEFRNKNFMFWLKGWTATFLAWMGRYLVLNCVLSMFTNISLHDHLVAFARQVVMFQVMLVSPTPGGSGFAEGAFTQMLGEYAPAAGTIIILASLWRLITYYPYMFVGIPLLPRWLRRVFPPRRKVDKTEAEEGKKKVADRVED